MRISDRPIPRETIASVGAAPFRLAISPTSAAALIPVLLLNALACWAVVESLVEGIYGHLVTDEPDQMEAFKVLLGWDRRAEALVQKVAQKRPDRQDHVAALLNKVKGAADIRNEIAHGCWAADDATPEQMLLFPNDLHGRLSMFAGRPDRNERTAEIIAERFSAGRVVGAIEARKAFDTINAAHDLMHSAWLAFFPAELDQTGQGMTDQYDRLRTDAEIAERAKNRASSRVRAEKTAARLERAAQFADRLVDGEATTSGPSLPPHDSEGTGQTDPSDENDVLPSADAILGASRDS